MEKQTEKDWEKILHVLSSWHEIISFSSSLTLKLLPLTVCSSENVMSFVMFTVAYYVCVLIQYFIHSAGDWTIVIVGSPKPIGKAFDILVFDLCSFQTSFIIIENVIILTLSVPGGCHCSCQIGEITTMKSHKFTTFKMPKWRWATIKARCFGQMKNVGEHIKQ